MKVYCSSHGGAVAVDRADCGSQVGCETCGAILSVPASPIGPGVVLDDFVLDGLVQSSPEFVSVRAHQMSLDREVMLKILRPEVSQDDMVLSAILKEARLSASLGHPHALKTYAINQDDGFYFLATEYVDGPTLTDYMAERGELPADWCLARLSQIAEVFAEAWESKQMLHGNLHTDDIFICRSDESVRVANMGRGHLPEGLATASDQPPELAYYAAPECLQGEPPSPQSEIYSLGAIAYRMLTGLVPAEGGTAAEVARGHQNGIVESVCDHRDGLPQSLAELLARMLAREPADRPADFREVIESLRSAALDLIAMPAVEQPVATTTSRSMKRRTKGMQRAAASPTLAKVATVAQMKHLDLVDHPPKGVSKSIRIGFFVIAGLLIVVLVLAAVVLSREYEVKTDPTSQVHRSPTDSTATTAPIAADTEEPAPTFSTEATFTPLPGPVAELAAGETLRIVCLGDWAIQGDREHDGIAMTLYESLLAETLNAEFFGNRSSRKDKGPTVRHDGYPGWSIDQMKRGRTSSGGDEDHMKKRFEKSQPDVVLLHIGTHDFSEHLMDADWRLAAERCMDLIAAIHRARPDAYVIVATLISPPTPEAQLLVDHYNRQLTDAVRAAMLDGQRLALVNMHRVVQRDWQTLDPAYPAFGERDRMATTWYRAITLFNKLRPPELETAPAVPIVQAIAADGTPAPGIIDGAGFDDLGMLVAADITPATSWTATAQTDEAQSPGDPIAYPPKAAPTIQLDLDGMYDISELRVWTLANEGDDNLHIGQPRLVDIQTSRDGKRWEARGRRTFLPAPITATNPGQYIDVKWRAVRHVRIRVLTVWEDIDETNATPHPHTAGLAEIQLYGSPSTH